jgi:hypothetical protein
MHIPERVSEDPEHLVEGQTFSAGIWKVRDTQGGIRYGVWLIPGGFVGDYLTREEALAVANLEVSKLPAPDGEGAIEDDEDEGITRPGFR